MVAKLMLQRQLQCKWKHHCKYGFSNGYVNGNIFKAERWGEACMGTAARGRRSRNLQPWLSGKKIEGKDK